MYYMAGVLAIMRSNIGAAAGTAVSNQQPTQGSRTLMVVELWTSDLWAPADDC